MESDRKFKITIFIMYYCPITLRQEISVHIHYLCIAEKMYTLSLFQHFTHIQKSGHFLLILLQDKNNCKSSIVSMIICLLFIEKKQLKYYHDYNYHKALNIMPFISIQNIFQTHCFSTSHCQLGTNAYQISCVLAKNK